MVSIQHTDSYQSDVIQKSVDAHFALLHLDDKLKSGMRVTLKPNLVMKRAPEGGTTTHPEMVKAIIRHLQRIGVTDITIADSPGGVYTKQALAGIYKTCGMEQVAEETGASLNYDTGSRPVNCGNGKVCREFEIINPVADADFVISVAKLKTHCMTGLSGGVKNLFGCIPGLTKPEFHWRFPREEDFCNMLVDLCETVKPGITFVDAVVSMEGDGPSSGELRDTKLTFCCENPYELDVILAEVIHKDPGGILTIANAAKREIYQKKAEEIPICGDSLKVFADFKAPRSRGVDFMSNVPKVLQPVVKPFVKTFLSSRPQVQEKYCVGCGKCAESCPAHTIEIIDGKAHINRENCIKCYCCHEMCPVHAIRVKRNRIFDL